MAGTRRKQAASGKASTAGRFKKLKKLNKEALKLVDQNAAEPEWPHDSTETDSGSLEPEC